MNSNTTVYCSVFWQPRLSLNKRELSWHEQNPRAAENHSLWHPTSTCLSGGYTTLAWCVKDHVLPSWEVTYWQVVKQVRWSPRKSIYQDYSKVLPGGICTVYSIDASLPPVTINPCFRLQALQHTAPEGELCRTAPQTTHTCWRGAPGTQGAPPSSQRHKNRNEREKKQSHE